MYYTNIDHTKRKALKLSLVEYAVFDSIYNISSMSRFTGKINRTYLADFFDITRPTVIRIIEKGIKIKVLNEDGNSTTEAWNNYTIISEEVLNNFTDTVKNFDGNCKKILHNNNNILINKDIRENTPVKRKILDLTFDELVDVWNSVQVSGWKKFNKDKTSSAVYRMTSSLFAEITSIKYSKDDFYSGLENYIKEIGNRKQSKNHGDYYYHRFSLYHFLKQDNGLKKFLLNE